MDSDSFLLPLTQEEEETEGITTRLSVSARNAQPTPAWSSFSLMNNSLGKGERKNRYLAHLAPVTGSFLSDISSSAIKREKRNIWSYLTDASILSID